VRDRRIVVIADYDHATRHRHITHVILQNAVWRDPTPTIAHPRKSTSSTTGNLTNIVNRRHQWISERNIEMNWAGVLSIACNGERASHDGPRV
jgi:hypothetical protein